MKFLRKALADKRYLILSSLLLFASVPASVSASPFGQGVFGANVPFGSGTSLTVALGGNPTLNMTPVGGNFEGSGSHTLTVTTTDVVGYRLYIYAPNTTMTSSSDTIAASANGTPGALAVNTWGYNTTGSASNFMGVTTRPVVIKDANGPFKNGDSTTVTYGVKVSQTKGAGDYSTAIVYTALCKSE